MAPQCCGIVLLLFEKIYRSADVQVSVWALESVCVHDLVTTSSLFLIPVLHWSMKVKIDLAHHEVQVHIKRLVQCLAPRKNVTISMLMNVNIIMINKKNSFAKFYMLMVRKK